MTPRHDVWDHRTRWKSGYNKAPNIQIHFHQLETLKVSSSASVPCLEMIGKRSSWGTSTDKDLNSKPRKVLMPITKGNGGRTLAKSNSLPPIYSPKTYVPSLVVGYQEQKLEKKANIVRMNRVLFDRQKQGCQLPEMSHLIFSRPGAFIDEEPDPAQRSDNLKAPVNLVKGEQLDVELSNLSANERERTKYSLSVSKGRCVQPLSASAIEMDTLSSLKKENEEEKTRMTDVEEEYYTDQRITAWIVKVNASLFSTSKEEITDHALEEQDVDTIKVIYGQD
ncbi:hypothetical protein E1301_Tti007260 [Triplophysa tibetana]|uniref:Uncharacterized protein n=1 Tax=Triplophysa tibetana TaxID=1572043 RepID=A0A5A9NWD2_9TELE|nr:hypothetical protein E1301_Tti007260 [Triplophysa tibetana]